MSPTAERPLRVLFFMHATNYDRVFENFLRALLERGHHVEVLVDVAKRRAIQGSGLVFDELESEYPQRFATGLTPERTDPWLRRATAWRLALDWLRFLEPEFEHATALRQRARGRAPRLIRLLVERTPYRRDRNRSRLVRRLRAAEAALPVSDRVRELIAWRSPDVVLVAPLVGLGFAQADYLRAARSLGIPVVLPVASWDNLTNKGRLRDVPDGTIVWNEVQVEEAVRLHDLPRGRVEATGAHAFDHWFAWEPSTTYKAFADKVGIGADRPMLLYVGSSSFVARNEVGFLRDWVAALRASRHEELRCCSVVVRPHPQHAAQWADVDLGPGVVVFPQGGVAPIAEQAKADYYDSLHHCRAVVGINTSAQIEAAIVGRPVLTFLDERFKATQEGTLHFSYLTGTEDAGVVTVARSWDEHLDQLAAAIADRDAARPRLEGFLRTFVRPHGLHQPAAPRAAAAVERAALAGEAGQEAELARSATPEPVSPLAVLAFRLLSVDVTGGRVPPGRIARLLRHLGRQPVRTYRKTRIKLGAIAGRGGSPETR
jgi:hypothetical protein